MVYFNTIYIVRENMIRKNMKKSFFLLLCVLFSEFLMSQENKAITENLKSKYRFVSYHDTDGGWYLVNKDGYKEKGKTGACDSRGREVIPPIWDDINYRGADYGGYYEVIKNGFVGIRDLNNKELLPCSKYTGVNWYQKREYGGFCVVGINNKYGAIDIENRQIIPCQYDNISIHQIKDYGFCMVQKDGKEGVFGINQQALLIPCQYDDIKSFSLKEQSFCCVSKGDYTGVYDILQKKEIIPCKYGGIYSWQLKDGNKCVVSKYKEEYGKKNPNNRVGIIDKDGNEILPCIYTGINICGNYAMVGRDGEYWDYGQATNAIYALYNLEEKAFATKFEYGYIGWFIEEEGIIRFNKGGKVVSYTNNKPDIKGGKWGYLDLIGNEVVPAQYDTAGDFKDGVTQVSKNGITSILTNPIKGSKLKLADASNMDDVDSNIPQSAIHDENLFAFIFANENYMHLKGADWAINDGKIFAEFCRKTIGVPIQNVRYYEDATYGNIIGAIKKVKDIADVYEGEAKIIIYFSGLGATDSRTKERYLLPSDASLESLKSIGFAVSELQKDLNELKTAYTLVILDAPFSNVDRTNHPLSSNRGVRIAPKKISPSGSAILFTGCNEDETAFSSNDYKHGMFTYALLKQLQTSKGNCTLGEMMDKASTWVRKESVKRFDRIQSPQQYISDEIGERWVNLKF